MEYKISGSDEWKKGKIMSTQTKSTGKYSWLNIIPKKEHEDPVCINWNYVNQWSELPQVRDEVNNQNNHETMCLVMLTASVMSWQAETWFNLSISTEWYMLERERVVFLRAPSRITSMEIRDASIE